MRSAAVLCLAFLLAAPAAAQREAISSTLSPEAAASAFNDAVVTACIPATANPNGMKSLAATVRSRFAPTNDIATRAQAGAETDEMVWDVLAARGVVTIHERQGRCTVSVYGPPAGPTMLALVQVLAKAGFERLVSADGFSQRLTKGNAMVVLAASEPGSPGHRSRFTVTTATISSH